jgi:Domain of unknown function (DUF4259)
MQTGVGGGDDDVAAAWLQFLAGDVDVPWLIDTTLTRVADGDGRWNLQTCQEAMAAAELVAAAGRKPGPELEEELLAWIEPHWPALWKGNRRAALAVVETVLGSSALHARWQGTENYDAWRRHVEDLRERLA